MRGADAYNEALFTTVKLEDFVPVSHPLRPIRNWVNDALAGMDSRPCTRPTFAAAARAAPEKLMRAMLLQVLYSVRQLVEQIQYNLLFRWFVGLAIDDSVCNHSGADKAYDTKAFVKACREIGVTPYVAQNTQRNGGNAIDARATRHPGYEVSQRKRKRIEQCFGWGKVIGPMRQVMVQGLDKVDQLLTLTMAAYNLARLRILAPWRPPCAR